MSEIEISLFIKSREKEVKNHNNNTFSFKSSNLGQRSTLLDDIVNKYKENISLSPSDPKKIKYFTELSSFHSEISLTKKYDIRVLSDSKTSPESQFSSNTIKEIECISHLPNPGNFNSSQSPQGIQSSQSPQKIKIHQVVQSSPGPHKVQLQSQKLKTPDKRKYLLYQTVSSNLDNNGDVTYGNFFSESQIKNGTLISIIGDLKNSVSVREPILINDGSYNNIDCKKDNNHLNLIECINDIYDHLNESEQFLNIKSIFENQINTNEKMYTILVDWLNQVTTKLKLAAEVLFMTVQLISRYLNLIKDIKRSKLQLLGISCLLIADKYESVNFLDIDTLVYCSDNAYTKKEIVDMEFEILKVLNFDLMKPNIFTFICRYLKTINADKNVTCCIMYVSERILEVASLTNYLPSMLASSILYVVNEKLNPDVSDWNKTMQYYTRYRLSDIEDCVISIKQALKIDRKEYQVYKKYSVEQYNKVSLLF